MTTVRTAVAAATARLSLAGVGSPRHDAEELAAHVLGAERGQLLRPAVADAPMPQAYAGLVAQREARVPLQHLTGRAYFRYLTLAVGPGVFVPRPETELVAQAAIDAARAVPQARVVDLGTGSGAIALAVATEVSTARVWAVEADPMAHAWAARNLAGSAVELRLGDFATAYADLEATLDVVVSNPPYIPPGAVPLDPEVRHHDPEFALYGGGEDGLAALRVVERNARRLLRPGGVLVVEHADTHGESAPAVLRAAGAWQDVTDRGDLTGRPRFVSARRVADPAPGAQR